MTTALEIRDLTKRFGKRPPAVDHVSITVPRRAIYGFLGANGAGKTTTLKLVLGLLRPDGGTIRLFGQPRGSATHRVGSLIETPSLYDHLTGRENLDIARRLLALPVREINRVLEIVDLDAGAANRRAGGYSLGMRQRLAIARALLGSPRLLILDEPANGLDPDGIRDMRALLRRLPETGDMTLIVSSHLLSEVELVATHVGLLHRGRLLLESPLEELRGGEAVEVRTDDPVRSARILIDAGFAVATDRPAEEPLLVTGAPPAVIAGLLVERGQALSHLASRRASLETIYHDQIARAA
ncbi:ATP-binding cassette domain-containing protein [Stakelama tenebrarum]|uniref:ATP-binding cassette domain-containing protein n=1 Tax=Stakelama tenebrarum TaxID=2711215 RepID=A0A6G6Y6E9_9SPHN|nr:ATP-binding cassette domain-containing protein [Sphingosinithalassobacter tenebrarum]QIG80490.1 ATP-binding cassette domain-containing protein [Sphingosinithalassobacter tenebrarum]